MFKKTTYLVLSAVILSATAFAFISNENAALLAEKDAVRKVVEDSYANGAFNKLDTDAMEKGFHRDFAIFTPKGEDIGRYPIKAWLESTKRTKAKPGFDPKNNVMAYEFGSVDVTGKAAAVKIEYSKGEKKVYTDYLLLSKFDSGWKIVAKVFHGYK